MVGEPSASVLFVSETRDVLIATEDRLSKATVAPLPPLITMSPLPKSVVPFIVFIFVPETKAVCLLLKISQSVSDKAPMVEVEAKAKLNT